MRMRGKWGQMLSLCGAEDFKAKTRMDFQFPESEEFNPFSEPASFIFAFSLEARGLWKGVFAMASSVASAIETEGGKKTLEEVTLGILDELGAAVRPARYVANEEALQWAIAKLESEKPSELDMEWYSIGDAEATKLAEALKDNTSLKTLKLRYNEIRDQGATALAKALEKHPNLESLTLGNNIIGSEGAAELARAAASGRKLKDLDLRYNSVGPELPQAFVNLTCLTRLNVSANHLETLPKALGTLTGLQSLAVERNHKLAPKNLGEIQALGELLAAIRNQGEAAGGDSAMRDA